MPLWERRNEIPGEEREVREQGIGGRGDDVPKFSNEIQRRGREQEKIGCFENRKRRKYYVDTVMPNKWRAIKSLVYKIRLLHDRRGKGTAESFSREKLRQALQQKEGGEILCGLPPVWPRLVRPQTWRPEYMGWQHTVASKTATRNQRGSCRCWRVTEGL